MTIKYLVKSFISLGGFCLGFARFHSVLLLDSPLRSYGHEHVGVWLRLLLTLTLRLIRVDNARSTFEGYAATHMIHLDSDFQRVRDIIRLVLLGYVELPAGRLPAGRLQRRLLLLHLLYTVDSVFSALTLLGHRLGLLLEEVKSLSLMLCTKRY